MKQRLVSGKSDNLYHPLVINPYLSSIMKFVYLKGNIFQYLPKIIFGFQYTYVLGLNIHLGACEILNCRKCGKFT
jgi:hypothetical protein